MNEITLTVTLNGQELYRTYKVSDEDLEDTKGRGDYFGAEIMGMVEELTI